MKRTRPLLSLAAIALLACGGSAPAADSGTLADSATADSGALADSATADSGTLADSATADSGALADSGTADSALVDSGADGGAMAECRATCVHGAEICPATFPDVERCVLLCLAAANPDRTACELAATDCASANACFGG